MALGIALKAILSMTAGTAVIVPISYLAANGTFSASPSFTYKEGENCHHLPLKPHENDKKLLVCIAKGDTNPIFKWWTKDDTESGKTEEISTLSWKKKAEAAATTKAFEMQIQLKNKEELITEEGQEGFYLPSKEIDKLEEKCSLTVGGVGGKFTFTCLETTCEGAKKPHTVIDTTDIVYSH